ncbi:MAG: uracil-DNA glycosylase [Gammaproteobacteria bacterium]|nr:uracil-DNA glycosylase [Gammaproteobacteria bacterium]
MVPDKLHYLRLMGITPWIRRDLASSLVHTPQETVAATDIAEPGKGGVMSALSAEQPMPTELLDWDALRARVAACQRCELHATRTQTVFGVGAPNADLMIVGEAPGEREDALGEPFVGRAGQLLNAMLQAIGLDRKSVFISNVLKCRPPRNRDPKIEESMQCGPYLDRQIALVRPKLLLAVGRIAAQTLLQTKISIGRLRGRQHRYGVSDLPLLVTYHPAYLLRSPAEKYRAWQDLKQVRRMLEERALGD